MARLSAALMMFALLIPVPASSGNFLENATQFKKPNLKWGQLEIHPYYRFSEFYDSNIYMKSPTADPVRGRHPWPVRGTMVTENNSASGSTPVTGMHSLTAYDPTASYTERTAGQQPSQPEVSGLSVQGPHGPEREPVQ